MQITIARYVLVFSWSSDDAYIKCHEQVDYAILLFES